jgi:hypothetical protein
MIIVATNLEGLDLIDALIDLVDVLIEEERVESLVHFCNTGKFLDE